jgi:hypothetical protein
VIAAAAGTPLAQTAGPEVERTQQQVTAQQRKVQSEQKAEAAAGIGETNGEEHQPEERDADGRLPWRPPERSSAAPNPPEPPKSKDANGVSGTLLDLSG